MPKEDDIATAEDFGRLMRQSKPIATAEDLRKAAEVEAYDPPERLVLPKSGFIVLVRRPRPLAYLIGGASLTATHTIAIPDPIA